MSDFFKAMPKVSASATLWMITANDNVRQEINYFYSPMAIHSKSACIPIAKYKI